MSIMHIMKSHRTIEMQWKEISKNLKERGWVLSSYDFTYPAHHIKTKLGIQTFHPFMDVQLFFLHNVFVSPLCT